MDLLQAEEVQRWPFAGPVGLVERDGDLVQTHVVQDWRHLGSLDGQCAEVSAQVRRAQGFDLDAYRILVRPLLSGEHEVVELNASNL